MNEKELVTIGFKYINQFGETFTAESTADLSYDLEGGDELGTIGRQFNAFLSQIGFPREHGCMFLRDIDEDEYYAIDEFLDNYRKDNKCSK